MSGSKILCAEPIALVMLVSNTQTADGFADNLSALMQQVWLKMCVSLCHLHAAVSQQCLHFVQADTTVDQHAGIGVS